jgi:hypothetical protein
MIPATILGNRGRSPGVNGRGRTRHGSGLRTLSVRLALLEMAFMQRDSMATRPSTSVTFLHQPVKASRQQLFSMP